jgi:heat shock protein HslJ
LLITPIVKTNQACAENLLAQENEMIAILQSVSEYEASSTQLKIFSPQGVLIFSNQPAVLSSE